jgi:hypothetical protein
MPLLDYHKEIKWCWDNNIKIYPKPKNGTKLCRIEINYKGSKHVSPEEYNQRDIYQKIIEYYQYYFNKRNQ